MGLFDSLKKSVGALADEIDKHKDDIAKEIEKVAGSVSATAVKKDSANVPADKPTYTPSYEMKPATDQFYHFEEIIDAEFADYEVKKRVSAAELDPSCHPKCAPIQFLFIKNGTPVLAVALVRTNNYRGMNVVATKKIVEDRGIKYLRFFEEYANEKEYVVNRIKNNL
ncbi:MAG: hypothetical protein K6C14_01165 [Eubacterium sp.]|nr:hypothetical protein [Eubacterium sp.]